MIKKKINAFWQKAKKLQGSPHYVAFGMAIGVFMAVTPTIPFHTIGAISLAFLLKASKPAAVLGVWVSNPVTVVFLYYACYKTGFLFFNVSGSTFSSIENLIHQMESDIKFSEKMAYLTFFLKTQMRTFLIMNVGGIILGIPSGVCAYFLTKYAMKQWRKKH